MTEETKLPKIRFKDGERNSIRDQISQQIERYVYSEPFPLGDAEVIEMIHDTVPKKIWEHIQAIRNYDKSALTNQLTMLTRIEGLVDTKLYMYDTQDDENFLSIKSRCLPKLSKYHTKVDEWTREVSARKEIAMVFTRHVGSTFYHCNTPGQVKTIFPALVELLPSRMHEALEKSTRATRWPDGLRNKDEFLAKSKEYENMIVLLKMVSSYSRTKPRFRIEVR